MSRIQSHWYRANGFLLLLLFPLECLFTLLSSLRRVAYRLRILRQCALPVPLVVVGNINVGGVGKTPLTLSLIAALRARGRQVGVISRGYGGQHRQATLVKAESQASEVGDEPCLFAATGVPVAVGRDRVAAARLLLKHYPELDVLLSDDGLQHYRLGRNLEIVVLDGCRGLGNGHRLPNGPLRESAARLAQVDAIVVNGEQRADLRLPDDVPRFAMQLLPGEIYRLGAPGERLHPDDLRRLRVVALAGIGHPERFFSTVRAQGIELEKTLAFPDHHVFQPDELLLDADIILVTSKDAAKLLDMNHDKLWVFPVEASVSPDLADWILARLEAEYGRKIS